MPIATQGGKRYPYEGVSRVLAPLFPKTPVIVKKRRLLLVSTRGVHSAFEIHVFNERPRGGSWNPRTTWMLMHQFLFYSLGASVFSKGNAGATHEIIFILFSFKYLPRQTPGVYTLEEYLHYPEIILVPKSSFIMKKKTENDVYLWRMKRRWALENRLIQTR